MSEMLNAQLVAELYRRGFRGWVSFAKSDYERLEARSEKELIRALKDLFQDSEDQIRFNPDLLMKIDWKRIFSEELANVNLRINRDLDAGRRADGSSMRSYSPSYKDYKREITGSDTVNLLVTGELRRSLTQGITTDKNSVELIFTGSHANNKPIKKAKKNTKKNTKKSPKK